MTAPPSDRLRIPHEDWPEEDQTAWSRAVTPGDIFTDPGPAAQLAAATKDAYVGTFGRWLRFLSRTCSDEMASSGKPHDREQVRAFIHALSSRLKPVSVWSELDRLHNFCFHTWPDDDWAWLRDIVNRLHKAVTPRSLPLAQSVTIAELHALGFDLMARSSQITPYRERDDSVMFRDGLMIALLSITALRRKNLWQLSLDKELKAADGRWSIMIKVQDMKNGVNFDMILPDPIGTAIDEYTSTHRPRLLAGTHSSRLWISKSGRPMTINRVGQRIANVTERHLGERITAHMFRHIAATSIATLKPELAAIIRPLLAHTTSSTAEKYYNKATPIAASRRVAENISNLRAQLQEP